jgi:hypothetical protein
MRDLMRRTAVTAAAVAGAAVLAGCSTAGMAAGAAPATALTAAEAGLPANAGPSPQTNVAAVSCVSAGNCTAVGSYADNAGDGQGLLLTQTSGTWTAGTEAPLPGNAGSYPSGVSLNAVSCVPAGNCTAVGDYTDRAGHDQGLLLTRTSGTWTAAEAPEPGNAGPSPLPDLISVSCASAGNCTAIGQSGLLLTQTSGTWAAAEAVLPGKAGPIAQADLTSLSCASAGNCTAVGSYTNSAGNRQGLLLTQTSGTWAAAEAVLPGNAGPIAQADLTSVSCASAGNCTAVGSYTDNAGDGQGLLLTQTSGTWAAGIRASLPGNAAPSPQASLASVSCASPGDCTAVGGYRARSDHGKKSSCGCRGLVLTQTSGTWAAGIQAPLPGNAGPNPQADLTSVTCASAGNCTAVSQYTDRAGHDQALLLTRTSGTWAAAEAPEPRNAGPNPQAGLLSVWCASAGNCTAVGDYTASAGRDLGLLVTQTSGTAPTR